MREEKYSRSLGTGGETERGKKNEENECAGCLGGRDREARGKWTSRTCSRRMRGGRMEGASERARGEGEMRVHRVAAERVETKCTGIYTYTYTIYIYSRYIYIYFQGYERRRRKLEKEREKERE